MTTVTKDLRFTYNL